jgi:hypothetical protein
MWKAFGDNAVKVFFGAIIGFAVTMATFVRDIDRNTTAAEHLAKADTELKAEIARVDSDVQRRMDRVTASLDQSYRQNTELIAFLKQALKEKQP